MVKELKEHKELMPNNLNTEFNTNLMQTFQALNLIEDHDNEPDYHVNDENVPPNTDIEQIISAMKGHRDPILEQLMKQMSEMQAQLGTLTN